MADFLLISLGIFAALLLVIVFYLLSRLSSLEHALSDLEFAKSSQSVKYGKMTEQFVPFTKDFPFDSQNFRFIGTPIDGVVFEEGRIIFAEFKASGSQLSSKQRQIKELVLQKKIEWFEHRVK